MAKYASRSTLLHPVLADFSQASAESASGAERAHDRNRLEAELCGNKIVPYRYDNESGERKRTQNENINNNAGKFARQKSSARCMCEQQKVYRCWSS